MLVLFQLSLSRRLHINPRRLTQSGSFVGRFCGRHLPSVTTSGRELRLTFVSGRGLPVLQHMGFRASVVAITKGIVCLPQRVLTLYQMSVYLCNMCSLCQQKRLLAKMHYKIGRVITIAVELATKEANNCVCWRRQTR